MERLIIDLIIWAIMGFAGYRMALWKNRSPWLGISLGVLLGVIGLVIMAFIPKKQQYVSTYSPTNETLYTTMEQRSDAA